MPTSGKEKQFINNILIPLQVLLWKYVKARCYRCCHTFWETFGGVSLFIVVVVIHQINIEELAPQNSTMIEYPISWARVFFTPSNTFTRQLMSRAEAYLNQGVLPKQQWGFEKLGAPLKFDDDELLFLTCDRIAEVKFKSDGLLPTELEYSISVVSDEAKNNLKDAYNGVLRTIAPKVEIAPPFLGQLQWAIDKSFIEQLSHQTINQEIHFLTIPNYITEELLTVHKFIIICTILGPLPFYLLFTKRLNVERKFGMKELMKHSGVGTGVLRFSHILEALLVGIFYSVAVTFILTMTEHPILLHSNFSIIAFTITFHFLNTMCFAFIGTALSQDFVHVDCLSLLLYLSTLILDFLWYSYKEYTYVLCCILPHAPIYLFWDEVLYMEKIGVGIDFWNIGNGHIDNLSVLRVWLLFVVQLVVTTTLSWYIDLVIPGYYGVPKKWNFFTKKEYWRPKIKARRVALPSYRKRRGDINFEHIPRKAEIALQVLNVSKVYAHCGYKKVIALNSVSFDCYKGEVTVLLGANGAGKTTLMHIIAGMFAATEGVVYLDGFPVSNKYSVDRRYVGLCMQQNICFKNLTVKENIMFFKKLKGKTKEGFSVDHLLKKLKLHRIADYPGSSLTKENMKCLQVACVLAGDADVLVLDEPTTGIDLEVRHRLWDLLMVLRGHKTVLMSTSCLEEADALGDRIAILDKGVLKCHGSPSFLKNIIGTSFTLSISIQNGSRLYDVKELVDSIIPNLECKIHDMRLIAFSFPTKKLQKLPTLLEALEEKTESFGIVLIDVGMFMEDVFSKFIDQTEIGRPLTETEKSRWFQKSNKERVAGFSLKSKQFFMLTERVFNFLGVRKCQFIALRFVAPIICFIIITLTTNYSWRNKALFNQQISKDILEVTHLLYNVAPFRRSGLLNDVTKYSDVETVYTLDIDRVSILPMAPFIILSIVERNCGIRDNHMMAGCTPTIHWGAKLMGHMIMFVIIILMPIIMVILLLDFDNTFTQSQFCGCLVALFVMFGLAYLANMYFLSFFLNENVAISEIYIESLLFGVILPIVLSVVELIWYSSVYIAVPYVMLLVVARLCPMFAFGVGLARLTLTARLNGFCKLNKHLCPDLEFDDADFDAQVCCESELENPFPYFVSYDTGLYDLINLFLLFVLYAILVLLMEYRIPQYLYEQFSFLRYKEPAQAYSDPSVMEERENVLTAIRDKNYDENALLVNNVHKDYKYAMNTLNKKKINPVRGITYAAKTGECLAILGPQSAGKSSLLKMLAGTLVMTRGDSCINGIFIRRNRMEYIHKISLSSSTAGMDDFMTGAQNLVFIGKLSGYSDDLARQYSYNALQCMGLLSNKSRVSRYSSGCLRRLSICSALVLSPSVAFLDEPMKELDLSSRPMIAKALLQLRASPAALIVSERSMDWRLLLPVFDRIAIMTTGQFAAIGPAKQIHELIAKGYTARIKLKMVTVYRTDRYANDASSESESETDIMDAKNRTAKSVMFAQSLNNLKSDFLETFNTSRLCREHLCMLHYYIEDNNQTQRYSVMFKNLQEFKEKYGELIEDYYLNSTTIDDIFWRIEYEKDLSEPRTSSLPPSERKTSTLPPE